MNIEIDKEKNAIYYRCCYGYMVSGMTILIIGAILPSLMKEGGFGYTIAGGLLSVLAIGNFCASIIFPILSKYFGEKNSMASLCFMVSIYFFVLAKMPPLPVIYLIMFLLGITKGSITLFNSTNINNLYENPTPQLNMINCAYAVGAFSAPFMLSFILRVGINWKVVLYILSFMCLTYAINYFTVKESVLIKYRLLASKVKDTTGMESVADSKAFLKSYRYYAIVAIVFFYIGVENCVNGWFVTYLKDTGIMNVTLATNMVSVMWITIMFSRIFWAQKSKTMIASKILLINSVGFVFSFFLLIATKNIAIIIIALILVANFMACFFPSAIAAAKDEVMGSSTGLAVLTGISSLGGIITPLIVGVISDHVSMQAAISTLTVNTLLVLSFAIINIVLLKKKKLLYKKQLYV